MQKLYMAMLIVTSNIKYMADTGFIEGRNGILLFLCYCSSTVADYILNYFYGSQISSD